NKLSGPCKSCPSSASSAPTVARRSVPKATATDVDSRSDVEPAMKPSPGYHLLAMASVRLFVYGSLKRGGRHHDELEGATFVGEASTLPGYRLEVLGEYLA